MPIVRESIEEETGIVPSSEVHPDEAVAIGAAYYVLDALKTEKKKVEKGESDNKQVLNAAIPETSKKYTFTDVTSHGIGIVCTGDNDLEFNSVILPKNTQVPAKFTNEYCTTVPFQEKLYIQAPPPLANPAKAEMIVIIGNVTPTPVSAREPTSGIRPI